jgi:hypothetical protein
MKAYGIPAVKLRAIRQVAILAHQHGNHVFVYIAGLECITANAAKSPHGMAKDQQRKQLDANAGLVGPEGFEPPTKGL